MGGRRCIIIRNAAGIQPTVPPGIAQRSNLEKRTRELFTNTAIAGEVDTDPVYSQVKCILEKPFGLPPDDLQVLLDVLHSFPETD